MGTVAETGSEDVNGETMDHYTFAGNIINRLRDAGSIPNPTRSAARVAEFGGRAIPPDKALYEAIENGLPKSWITPASALETAYRNLAVAQLDADEGAYSLSPTLRISNMLAGISEAAARLGHAGDAAHGAAGHLAGEGRGRFSTLEDLPDPEPEGGQGGQGGKGYGKTKNKSRAKSKGPRKRRTGRRAGRRARTGRRY